MEIVNVGMGKADGKQAKPGKRVTMKYVGKLQSGKIFDQTKGAASFQFRLGVGEVIKGWDVGVDGMRVGDKRRLTVPPAMAYGKKGVKGAIPANATLVFDVELVNVQ
jgi:FK506-binding nuclear protein